MRLVVKHTLLFFTFTFILCSCLPVDRPEQKKKKEVLADTLPEKEEEENWHASGTKVIDTSINNIHFNIRRVTDHYRIIISSDNITSNDSNTYHRYNLSMESGKKKLCFPFKSMLKKRYSFLKEYQSREYWSSKEFSVMESKEWKLAVPLCYFSDLNPGLHDIVLKCEVETNIYEKKKKTGMDSIGFKYATILVSQKTDKISLPLKINVPELHLRKIVVGNTEMVERSDYDEGLYHKPDVYYLLTNKNENYYRSKTEEQSMNPEFGDTVYFISEKPPKKMKLSFYDEDMVFDDLLSGIDIPLPEKEKFTRLGGSSKVKYTSYWISKDFILNGAQHKNKK